MRLRAVVMGMLVWAVVARACELPAGFVYVADEVPGAREVMSYYTKDNFVGRPIDGYDAARCVATREAAEALAMFATAQRARGRDLVLYDCYRPQLAVDNFAKWARDTADTTMKARNYPEVAKKDLFHDGYIALKSGHSRGSTVDIGLVAHGMPLTATRKDRPCTLPAAARNDSTVDMGTSFDCFSPQSFWNATQLTREQRAERSDLRLAMAEAGFRPLAEEHWHFTLDDEPFPSTYFDFPVC